MPELRLNEIAELRLTDPEPHTYYVAWTRYSLYDNEITLCRSRLFHTYEEAHLHRADQRARVHEENGAILGGGITQVSTHLIEDEEGHRLY